MDRLKSQEPWLTTTKAISTSSDRLDGTSIPIMKQYYTSIDELHERYPDLDLCVRLCFIFAFLTSSLTQATQQNYEL